MNSIESKIIKEINFHVKNNEKNESVEFIVEDYFLLDLIKEHVKLPRKGMYLLFEGEIRYYPNFNETYYDNGTRKYKYNQMPDIITDYYGFNPISQVYLNELDLLKEDPIILDVNFQGFRYIKNPFFHLTYDKFLYLIDYYGSKKDEFDDYTSPIIENDDKLLNSLNKGDIVYF